MLIRHVAAGFLVCAFTLSAAAQEKNTAATSDQRKDKFAADRHDSFVKRAKEGDVNVLFLGDSITQGWEGNGKKVWEEHFAPMKAANFGIGGDRTQHVLWRLTTGKELEGIQPKVCVLMIGTNNAGSNSAAEIAAGVAAVVKELHHQRPEMKVLLLGVFPRTGKGKKDLKDPSKVQAGEFNVQVEEVNKIISKLDDGKTTRYLDIGPKFLDADGALPAEIMPDFLHLSAKGYAIWAESVKERVAELTKS